MRTSKSPRTHIRAVSLLMVVGALNSYSSAAPGDVDLSFDPGSGVNGAVHAVAVQPDGKLIIGGEFTTVKGLLRPNLARLNADGSSDASFDAGAVVDRYVSAIALQSDGKVLVTRDFYNLTGAPPGHKVARLNSDGTLDNSFLPDTGTHPDGSGYTCMAVQPDGKVVLGGYFNDFYVDEDGYVHFYRRSLLIRLNADGTSDSGFTDGNGKYGGSIGAVALQPDGKILIAGSIATTVGGTSRYDIARLNADGSLDGSFEPGVGGFVLSVVVQPDGRFLIAGGYIGNGDNRKGIARLNADGSLDKGFQPGLSDNSALTSLALQVDGKVLVGGGSIYVNGVNRNGIARLNADGSVDDEFDSGTGTGAPDNAGVVFALEPDGKVFVAGAFTKFNGTGRDRVARLNADGNLDVNFNPGSAINGGVRSVVVQSDGKVLIGGDFTIVDGSRNRVARLDAHGSMDGSFDPGIGVSNEYFTLQIASVAAQPDGKVLIGGDFRIVNSTSRNRIARLHADGSLDMSFNPGIGAPGGYALHVSTLVVQADGKVLVGGDPSLGNGANPNGVARLLADGSLDIDFDPNVVGNSSGDYTGVNSLVVQSDGKILAGGYFVKVGGGEWDYRDNLVTRLNPDGSRDTSFNGTGTGIEVRALALQSDGKVLIGSSLYDGTSGPGIARLNADGGRDLSFDPGFGVNGTVNSIAVQPDGRILIGGLFSAFNGMSRNGIARLHADGSLDRGFDPGTGTDGVVDTIVLQPDGNVLIGGSFITFNGVVRPYVARLYGGSAAGSNFLRGDSNADGSTDLGDAVAILFALFMSEPIPCSKAADVNNNGKLGIPDAIFLLSYLFLNGQAPDEPLRSCGIDQTPDELTCDSFPACP